MNYLTQIPSIVQEHGICKTLAVRREVIHIKHIFTEIFVRQTIDVNPYLGKINMDLFTYMKYMTNRIRKVHNFNRNYVNDCDEIVKHDRCTFFPTIELLSGLNNIIVLDFDGVITDTKFRPLYNLCIERSKVQVCSGNPSIKESWFNKKDLKIPSKIHSMQGKVKKIRRLIELASKYDYIFYVDNEKEYLEYAWLFGIHTFHWNGKNIKHYSKYSK